MKTKRSIRRSDVIALIVVAIFLLGSMAAIGATGRGRAKELVCLSNLRQWGRVFESFTKDNEGYFLDGTGGGSGLWWIEPLWPYHQSPRLSLCPAATSRPEEGRPVSVARQAWQSMQHVGSYGINGWTCDPASSEGSVGGRAPGLDYWRAPARAHDAAGNAPVFSDMMWMDAWPRETDQPSSTRETVPDGPNEMGRVCIDRHDGAVNLLLMDWSARRVGLKELWTLKWHRRFNTAGPWTTAGGVWASDWPEWMRDLKTY